MGLKYYMPENHENLAACEGFYIDNKVFFGADEPDETQWDASIKEFIKTLRWFLRGMKMVNCWENSMGIRRYVLMRGDTAELILGEDERYASFFLIIPEDCTDEKRARREFGSLLNDLRGFLLHKYPEQVYKRKNTWNLELITGNNAKRRRIV